MNRLLLSSLLATGLAFGASGVFAADQYGSPENVNQQAESYQQNTSADSMRTEGGEYTIQSGDTLSSIAESELGSQDRWQEIAEANDIDNPDRIYAGQTLAIPSGQSGASNAAHETAGEERASIENPSGQNEVSDNGMSAKSDESMIESPDDQASDDQNELSMDQSQRELKGEITEIGTESDSFSLRDEQGMTHLFTKLEDDEILEEVSVGDFVKVEIEDGTVVSLEKVDRSA